MLKAVSLKKSYGQRAVVQDVSLSVTKAEVVGLLGPNGAGKTTSFYMVAGLVAMDAGQVFMSDHDISRFPIHKRAKMGLGYLPQEASIFRRMTVEENIRAVVELNQLGREETDRIVQSLLDDLHIEHLRDNKAPSLSGGERRRVEIARVLATQPRFILLDEPFAGVDPIAVMDIQRVIAFLRERGIGILITDHNVRETLKICDRAYIISEGQVLAMGSPQDIVNDENVRRVYLGEHFYL